MTTRLWALTGTVPTDPADQERLAHGLQQHVQVVSLQLVLQQMGSQTRTYLATEGCGGCLHRHCEVGCRTDLLRRTLQATCPQMELRHVPLGLAARSYTHRWLAWPTKRAQPLTTELLSGWADARLMLHWQPALLPRHPATLTALLLTDADATDGAARLRSAGWKPLHLPGWLPIGKTTHGLPPNLPPGRRPPFAPFIIAKSRYPIGEPVDDRPRETHDRAPQHAVAADRTSGPRAAIDYRLPAIDTAWEPLPDPFVAALAAAEHEVAGEQPTVSTELVTGAAAEETAPAPNGHPEPLPAQHPPVTTETVQTAPETNTEEADVQTVAPTSDPSDEQTDAPSPAPQAAAPVPAAPPPPKPPKPPTHRGGA